MTILYATFYVLFLSVFCAHSAPVRLHGRTTHYGRGTWFNVGLGNCGEWNVNTDRIVAISEARYQANGGANCEQYIEIINTSNGKKTYGLTRDSCEGCGYNDLDMSPTLFGDMATLDIGAISVEWHFMNKEWKP